MIVTISGQILFLGLMAICALALTRLLRLDLTLAGTLTGIVFALLLPVIDFDTGIRATNMNDLVFFVVIPVLIFEAAWHIKVSVLRKWIAPVLLLAIPGVLISCVVTAALTYLGIGHPTGFPWIAALITGAVLAATDPASVVAKLQTLNAPEDLAVVVEGESIFNDASALVLFGIVMTLATGSSEHGTGLPPLLEFCLAFFGGALAGALVGLVAGGIVIFLKSVPATSVVLVLTAFGSFYVAEHLLNVSGVMSVVFAAIVSRYLVREKLLEHQDSVQDTWDWLGLLFNVVLFAMMGLVITFEMFEDRWLAMLIVIGAALVARVVAVFLCCSFSRVIRRPIPFSWQTVLVWGGLRGTIAIALVLSLPIELPYWYTVQSMVFGFVLFTVLIQGTTIGWVVRKLKLIEPAGSEKG